MIKIVVEFVCDEINGNYHEPINEVSLNLFDRRSLERQGYILFNKEIAAIRENCCDIEVDIYDCGRVQVKQYKT